MVKIIALIYIAAMLSSCHTITMADGSRHRLPFLAHDRSGSAGPDTSLFIRQPFSIQHYTNKVARTNGKRIIETIEGPALQALADAKGRHYIHFWNPSCPASRPRLHKLDSLAGTGRHIIIVSLRSSYSLMNSLLAKTNFAAYPLYVVEAKKYSNILLRRQVNLIADACPPCYQQYKDDLGASYLFLVDEGKFKVIPYNDKSDLNILAD